MSKWGGRMKNTYKIMKRHIHLLEEGEEIPLYIDGKDTGSRVRLMPVLEEEEMEEK